MWDLGLEAVEECLSLIKKNNIDTPEKFWVKDKIVACDGGEDYGHPLIYLNIAKSGKVEMQNTKATNNINFLV